MDADFVVRLDFEKVAKKARLRADRRENYEEAVKAMGVLMAPDAYTMVEQKDDGIRVKEVEGGYFVVSGEKYQELMYEVNKARRRKRAQRERRAAERVKSNGSGGPSVGERAAAKAAAEGDTATAVRLEELQSQVAPGTLSISAVSGEGKKMDTREPHPVLHREPPGEDEPPAEEFEP